MAAPNGVRTKQPGFHALITTYEVMLRDKDVLRQFNWEFLVVDEVCGAPNVEAYKCRAVGLSMLPAGLRCRAELSTMR